MPRGVKDPPAVRERKQRDKEEKEAIRLDKLYDSKVTKMHKNLQKKGVYSVLDQGVLVYDDKLLGQKTITSLEDIARIKVSRGYVMKFASDIVRREGYVSKEDRLAKMSVIVPSVYNVEDANAEFRQYLSYEMDTREFKEKVDMALCKMVNASNAKRVKNKYFKYAKCKEEYIPIARRTEDVYTLEEATALVNRMKGGDASAKDDFKKFSKSRTSKNLFGYEPRDIPGYGDAITAAMMGKPAKKARRAPTAIELPRRPRPAKRTRDDEDEEEEPTAKRRRTLPEIMGTEVPARRPSLPRQAKRRS